MAYTPRYIADVAQCDPLLAEKMQHGISQSTPSFVERWMLSGAGLSAVRNLTESEIVQLESWIYGSV